MSEASEETPAALATGGSSSLIPSPSGDGQRTAANTADVLAGFGDMVATLGSASSSATKAPRRNEDEIANVIGGLKILQNACQALDAPPTPQSIELTAKMAGLALTYLPEDTRDTLRANECGSDVAMELVCRNLTQLPVLAKTLYQVCLHYVGDALSELRLLVVSHGSYTFRLSFFLTDRICRPSFRNSRWVTTH